MKIIMKKLLICILFICAFGNVADAQTYYYKLTEKVDPQTGVRESYYRQIYVTFTQEFRYCYESDKNGRSLDAYSPREMTIQDGMGLPFGNSFQRQKCDYTFQYIGKNNNMFQYRCKYEIIVTTGFGIYSSVKSDTYYHYVNFSTDFKRINIQKDSGGSIIVGELATPPGQASAPTQMW